MAIRGCRWERGHRCWGLWRSGKRIAFIGLPPRPSGKVTWSIDGSEVDGDAPTVAVAKRVVEEVISEKEPVMGNRTLNMMLAEDVMGWTRRLNADVHDIERDPNNSDHDWLGTFDNHWWSKDAKPKQMGYVEDEGLCREDFEKGWSPFTDIAAAMEVVEKMRGDGWKFSVEEWEGSARVPKGLMVVFRRNNRTCAGVRESLAAAVCEAALFAHGLPESVITNAMKETPRA